VLRLVLRFLSDILNRQVKVIRFWDCRPLSNLEKDNVPNLWESWLSVRAMVDRQDQGLHKNDFIMAAKTDKLL
jgi:hypothetical protein